MRGSVRVEDAERRVALGRPGVGTALLALAILLTGLNLRTAVTTVGPLLAELESGLGMSSSVAGLLTTLPVVCFAALGALAPALVLRFGEFAVLGAALVVMTAGLVARAAAGSTWFFLLMSVLALTGGAVGNVVLPGVVKRYFPERTGLLVAGYSTALALGQGVGAALAVPIARLDGAQGWRLGLGAWAVVSAVAVLPWLALVLTGGRGRHAVPGRDLPGVARMTPRMLVRSKLAWALTVFFGAQSAVAYIVFGWFAQFFRDAGASAQHAGLLAAIVSLLAIPVSLVVPTVAVRMRTQRTLVLALVGAEVVGFTGMLVAPVSAGWLWMTIVGLGLGLFPLNLTLLALRARTAGSTAAISAFAQGIGYVLAASGPLLVGVLREATGGWNGPFVVLFALAAVMIPVGWYAAGDRYLEDDLAPRTGP